MKTFRTDPDNPLKAEIPPRMATPIEITESFEDLHRAEDNGALTVEYKTWGAFEDYVRMNIDYCISGSREVIELTLEAPDFPELRRKFVQFIRSFTV